MNDLKQLPDMWSQLQKETRPIVLYGMGDGANKILNICDERGIPIGGVFASDGFAKKRQFHQWTVVSLGELEKELGNDLVILLAFGSARPGVMEDIERVSARHTFYIPDLPVAGDHLFDSAFLREHWDEILAVNDLWGDDLSRRTYGDLLTYKITGEMQYLQGHTVSREEMFRLFSWGTEEIFIDGGAYRGDTIEEFIRMVDGAYEKIIGLEPDGKNFLKLKKNLEQYQNVSLLEAAAWDGEDMLYFQPKSGRSGRLEDGTPNTRAVAVDDLTEDHIATYMKYDVEGAEWRALEGSRKTIQKSMPKLLISIYHRPEDLFQIPLLMKEMAPEYTFYLRRNEGYPAWDINLLCIKE